MLATLVGVDRLVEGDVGRIVAADDHTHGHGRDDGGGCWLVVWQFVALRVVSLAYPRPGVEARFDVAQRPAALAGERRALITAGVRGKG